MSQRTNSDNRFRDMLRPTLTGVHDLVRNSIQREVENLLDSYGTEHWDDRDVTFDNLVWGTSGIEIPIKRILYQVELVMQDAVSKFMPEIGNIISDELQRTLEAHEVLSRLHRSSYEQDYMYSLPGSEPLHLQEAYQAIINRVSESFRQVCQQATMYELMKPERSIYYRLDAGERELPLADNERLLDMALHGVDRVKHEVVAQAQAIVDNAGQERARNAAATTAPAIAEDELVINILDQATTSQSGNDFLISFPGEGNAAAPSTPVYEDIEASYAEKLDNIAAKTNKVFSEILNDLFGDDDLLPRLRRLFWLEATKAERDFNNHIVKPMLRQHDRNLHRPELRKAMEVDLESISDLEELMRVWDGLHKLEMGLSV